MTTSGVSGDDYLTGSDGSDKLVGGGGSDTIDGGAGSDFINAGGGDDVILYDEADYKILGGGGYDALWFTGSHQQLDLGSQAVKGIEALWLGGDGGHDVWFSADDVVRISDNDRFVITGDASSRLHIGSGWSFQGLTSDGQSQLLTNGLASLTVELPVFVEGFSNNATVAFADGADTAVTEDEASGLLEASGPLEASGLLEASGPLEASGLLEASGQLIVDDPNAGQGLLQAALLGMPLSGSGTLGTLTVNLVTPDSASAPGVYDYRYQVDNDAVQSLGAGVVRNETFTLTTIDGTPQMLTLTVTGVNDAPMILDDSESIVSGLVTELDVTDTNAGSTMARTVSGSFVVADVDLGDMLTASAPSSLVGAYGALNVSIGDPDSAGRRTVEWTYTTTDAQLDPLAAGERVEENFQIQLSDGIDTVGQTIVVTLEGAADALPTITATIVESDAGYITYDNPAIASTGGSFSVSSGANGLSVVASSDNIPYLGNLTASLNNGAIDWSFSVRERYIDYLITGETLTQNYHLSWLDENGSMRSQEINIKINGLDDASMEYSNPSVSDSEAIFRLEEPVIELLLPMDIQVYGTEGDDQIFIDTGSNYLIRGGDGDDMFSIRLGYGISEIYGDNGEDVFYLDVATGTNLWGGPDSDTYIANRQYFNTTTIKDFDFESVENGGDKILFDFTSEPDSGIENLQLRQLGEELYGLIWVDDIRGDITILTLVGSDLTIDMLKDGHLGAIYSV